MIHELRIYHCAPGKLPEVSKRFATITLALFANHGIRQVGFWTTLIGPNSSDLYYILEWDSLADRETKWNAFAADPEWLQEKAKTEQQGALIDHFENIMLNPTSYSALK